MNELMGRVRLSILSLLLVLGLSPACERMEPPCPESVVTYTLTAGFEGQEDAPETRSTLSLNEEGTSATLSWTPGDQFKMIRGYSSTTFTTTGSGKCATFTAQGSLPSSGACYSLYPAGSLVYRSRQSNGESFVLTLPAVQQAVAGGIRDGLNLSVAYSATPTEDLTFRNVLCYIRFRLSGEATAQVSDIVLDADTPIAGDLTVSRLDGNLTVSSQSWPTTQETPSSTVRLVGPFTPGEDYFIALRPVSLSGFDLYFRNAPGRSIRKHSSRSLTLQRSHIYDFGTIALGDDFDAAVNHVEQTVRYQAASAGHKAIDLCVIPDGFREQELPAYQTLAQEAIDYLFETEPYKTYRDRFNVYIMSVPSAESGASVTNIFGLIKTRRDTYFMSRWGENSYDGMTADDDRVFSFVSRNCPSVRDGSRTIREVPILLIINDNRYAAISHIYADGRGYAMAPHFYDGAKTQWYYPYYVPNGNEGPSDGYHVRTEEDYADIGLFTGDWRNTALHEFGGHVIARLYDEYWSGTSYDATPTAVASQSWTVPNGLNVTHKKDAPPWKEALLDPQESLIARDTAYGRVGVWQGAGGQIFNRWRSEKTSCMIDNRPYFSAWQRILIVKRILSLSGEGFSLENFFARDVATDPVRELLHATPSAFSEPDRNAPIVVPMPAPPVLHDGDEALTLPQRKPSRSPLLP